VSGSTVTGVTAGSCIVAANQAGNANYTAAPQVTQSFSVGRGAQSITFGAVPGLVFGGTATVSATATSGLPVSFSSTTPSVCTLSGNLATALAMGNCVVAGNQIGNANYNVAPQVTQTLPVGATVPGSPSMGSATPGNHQATVIFGAPASDGGSAITGYTVTCNPEGGGAAASASASTSPIVVTGLVNGTSYGCSVRAQNAVGVGPASATTLASLPRLLASLSLSGPTTLDEGSSADYSLVAAFDNGSSASVVGTLSLAPTTYATLTGITLSAGVVGANQVVTLDASYEEGGVTKTASLSVTIRKAFIGLVPGWNLIGNARTAPWDVATLFNDPAKVVTVWKWVGGATPAWAFYSPLLPDGGAAYALANGYQVLTTVNGGEGVWVNAQVGFSLTLLPSGLPVTSAGLQDVAGGPDPLPSGWSLISVDDNPSPRVFANAISLTGPVGGAVAATSLVSLWAWYPGDAANGIASAWYFYAPSLDNAGTLADYAASQSYLDFMTTGKNLDPATGFWVNRP